MFYIATQIPKPQMGFLTGSGWRRNPAMPNGKLSCSQRARGRGIWQTSSDGRLKQHMLRKAGDAREPVWDLILNLPRKGST